VEKYIPKCTENPAQYIVTFMHFNTGSVMVKDSNIKPLGYTSAATAVSNVYAEKCINLFAM
jgi:hypothetical protein